MTRTTLALALLALLAFPACGADDTTDAADGVQSHEALTRIAPPAHRYQDVARPDLRADAQLRPSLLEGAVKDGRIRLPADCTAGAPIITAVQAHLIHAGAVEVEIRGETCGTELMGFRFSVYNSDGIDISGRSWPELESIEQEDGRFILRGDAAGCSNYSDAREIGLMVQSNDMTSERMVVEVDRSRYQGH